MGNCAGSRLAGGMCKNKFITGEATDANNRKWDKVFTKSASVDVKKVTFKNRYGITLAGDLYLPKNKSSASAQALSRTEASVSTSYSKISVMASPGLLRSFPSRIFFRFSIKFLPTKPLLPVTRIFIFPPPSAVPVHSPLSRFSPPCRPHPEAGYCGWCTPHPLPL